VRTNVCVLYDCMGVSVLGGGVIIVVIIGGDNRVLEC